jgi:hypothetical protein
MTLPYLIAELELAVLIGLLLDGVVGEVDHLIGQVVDVEVGGGGADVALLVPVALQDTVAGGRQQVATDVEFAFVV